MKTRLTITAKISQKESGYEGTDSETKNCHTCKHVETHGDAEATCDLVYGNVDPEHVCKLWKAK